MSEEEVFYHSRAKVPAEQTSLDTQVGGDHYKSMAIQPIEFIQKNQLPYCEAAVIKYVCRHRRKNGRQDVEKAIHFLEMLLEMEYGYHETNDFDVYQALAEETAIYPTLGHTIVYPALGLNGEAGEVAEKVKKLCRDSDWLTSPVPHLSAQFKESLKKELGDVLWYVSEVARQAGLTLSEVANTNIEKLSKRKQNGTIGGSGDDR